MALCGGRDCVCPLNTLCSVPRIVHGIRWAPKESWLDISFPWERKEKKAEMGKRVIHSHHLYPKIEISINSLGEVVVLKLFLFVSEG